MPLETYGVAHGRWPMVRSPCSIGCARGRCARSAVLEVAVLDRLCSKQDIERMSISAQAVLFPPRAVLDRLCSIGCARSAVLDRLCSIGCARGRRARQPARRSMSCFARHGPGSAHHAPCSAHHGSRVPLPDSLSEINGLGRTAHESGPRGGGATAPALFQINNPVKNDMG